MGPPAALGLPFRRSRARSGMQRTCREPTSGEQLPTRISGNEEEAPMHFRRHLFTAAMILGACQAVPLSDTAAAAPGGCKLEISGNDQMQYDKKELTAAGDCTEIEVTLTHAGKQPAQAMGHNWVLVRTADADAVATAGVTAGLKNNHIPPGDKRVIASTKVVGGGETTSVKFPAQLLTKGESYTYLCTFPGHNATMKGRFILG
jgi:azurin